ncbi:MAG: hypothetical protein IKQ69_00490 [Oscillospiraceae bacterium]|nr:hypothetical protein [Oscillospiraceae bacterium]
MESLDYLKGIRASNKYQYALLTTYNFEIGFFESFILNSLLSNGVKTVSVFVDGKQLVAALENAKDSFIGKRYVVNPIRMDAAFHPKLLLLLGQNIAKLYVSSANLTTSGICINNEIVNEYVYDANHPENLKVISQAITLFEKLDKLSYGLDENLFTDIRQLPYYGKTNVNQSMFLMDNIDEPILDQIQRVVQTTESIDIAVPYYDNSLSVVEELINRYQNASIKIWLQNGKSRFPMWKTADRRFTIKPYRGLVSVNDGKSYECDSFYHGKVFRFRCADKSYILYGSANCTKSALSLSYRTGGNIECDILEVGEPAEFEGFFDGFIEDATELTCDNLNDEPVAYPTIHFMYGTTSKSETKLFFGYSKAPQQLSVFISETMLPFTIGNNRIEVTIDPDLLSGLPEVFSVSFSSDMGKEEVKCWVLYKDYLDLFRLPDETGGIFTFEIDSADDKYLQDRYALLSAYSLSVEGILREAEIERHFQRNVVELDPENNDDDDGIIDYIPPSIDIIRQHKIIGRIRHIEAVFRDSFSNWITTASQMAHGKTGNGSTLPPVEPTHVNLDQDQSFIRFVKAQYKKLMNPDYQSKVDPERFYSVMLAFFEIFDKYTVFSGKEPEEMLIGPLFAAEAKTKLLLSIKKMRVLDETSDNLIALTFLTIIINHLLNAKDRDRRIDNANKQLLASIAQDELFRTQGYLQKVVLAVDMLAVRSAQANLMAEINYVDSLFGYKPLSKIKETIQDEYGKSSQVSINDDQIYVEVTADSISNYMIIREGSLRDINNYVKMQGRFKSFFVDIVSRGISKGPNPAIRVSYRVSNLPSSVVRQRIYRKNGKIEENVKDLSTMQ